MNSELKIQLAKTIREFDNDDIRKYHKGAFDMLIHALAMAVEHDQYCPLIQEKL